MPLYEYACQSCGRRTEALQRVSDAPLSVCPHCGGELKKLVSAPAFQFKGSGWYVTDYARKSGSSAGKGDTESAGSGAKESPAAPAESGAEGGAKKPEAPKPGRESGGTKPPSGE
jgi:putative FmdB family regulatory protein